MARPADAPGIPAATDELVEDGGAVRLAEIFDVSTDYLLIGGAPRRRFGDPGDEFTERLSMAGHLSAADKAAISHIIDGLLANTRIRAALDEAQ